jgi:hypothetical protein
MLSNKHHAHYAAAHFYDIFTLHEILLIFTISKI